jgi:hypothetical protein
MHVWSSCRDVGQACAAWFEHHSTDELRKSLGLPPLENERMDTESCKQVCQCFLVIDACCVPVALKQHGLICIFASKNTHWPESDFYNGGSMSPVNELAALSPSSGHLLQCSVLCCTKTRLK